MKLTDHRLLLIITTHRQLSVMVVITYSFPMESKAPNIVGGEGHLVFLADWLT